MVDVPTPKKPPVPKMAVVLTVVTFWVTAYKVPNRVAAFPIATDELLAKRFPLNVEKAPWTVRFCCNVVLPTVLASPKLVMVGISSKGKHLFPVENRALSEISFTALIFIEIWTQAELGWGGRQRVENADVRDPTGTKDDPSIW